MEFRLGTRTAGLRPRAMSWSFRKVRNTRLGSAKMVTRFFRLRRGAATLSRGSGRRSWSHPAGNTRCGVERRLRFRQPRDLGKVARAQNP
jgi:hypothetical protein